MSALRHSDAAITAAIETAGGNLLRAAKSLGYSWRAVSARIDRNPALWPAGVARRGRGRPSGERDEVVAAALRLTDGHQTRAAQLLHVGLSAVRALLRRRPSVWPAGVARRGRGRPSTFDGPAFTQALRDAGGNLLRAAEIVGVSRQAVSQRLAAHPDLWPAEVPRRACTKGGAQ